MSLHFLRNISVHFNVVPFETYAVSPLQDFRLPLRSTWKLGIHLWFV